MKAIYQILALTLKHNHATTSYVPYEDAQYNVFTTYEEAESWLNNHLTTNNYTGECGFMIPAFCHTSYEYTEEMVYQEFSKEERFSIVKLKLIGDVKKLVSYEDAETDLPF
ncbi:hypothetical protein [Clostridium sp.]|jgi:viroplasmin and RNaseH domain-containing protein|uniref:hypothetical protein n=1 Tax=Clostridium sp. TaxID=1506 RepID=UPI003EEF3FA6